MLQNKKWKNSVYLLGVILITSCQPAMLTSYSLKNILKLPGDKKTMQKWIKTVVSNRDSAKVTWLKDINETNDWAFYKGNITKENFAELDMLPTINYTLDFKSFSDLNNKSRLVDLISIDTTKFGYYTVRNNKLVNFERFDYVNNILEYRGGTSGIFPGIAGRIETLMKENQKVFKISVYYQTLSNTRSFVAYYNGKEIMEIKSSGEVKPLLPYLLDFKDKLEQNEKYPQTIF